MSETVDLRQTVGDRLRKIRLQRGLSGEDVHAAIGISRGTLWRWEMGKTEGMPAAKLAALATLYGVSLDVIWFGEGRRQQRPAQGEADG
jgi:transcriptional regulator with XRE-family HTH domain